MAAFSRDRWKALEAHLDKALDLDDDQREEWLASLGVEHPSLAGELRTLMEELRTLDREAFLEQPVPLPSAPALAGQTVGAYTLISPIGEGGMGSVWLARRSDGRFEGQAAVKFLNVALIGGAGEARFKREGTILARITHPSIAHLTDAGVSAMGQPYLVLEHVEGQHIDRYCDERRLDIDARIRLFLDVLAPLAHAHANLVVHRDIKPSNVLVTADGRVKLLDFGIAKLLEGEKPEDVALTRKGTALTPEFAAPEQLTGDPITTATDVYSLGVLLYVLLVGQHPVAHRSESAVEIVKAIIDTEPRRLSDAVAAGQDRNALAAIAAQRATTIDKLLRAIEGDLDTIVAKALKKRPQERYASVAALADDLRRYLDHLPIRARPDTIAYRTAKFVRRRARAVAAAAVGVALLAGLVGFYTVRLRAERDRARVEAEKAAKISELLTGLLTTADPYASSQDETTIRSVLAAGALRVEKELADQPELQAEMLTTIGRVYERLSDYERAQPLLERALAIARKDSEPENVRTAQALNDLGVLRRDKGDYAAAGPMLEEALALRRRLLGLEHKDVAVTLVELGRLYADQGLDDRAEPLFREALVLRQKLFGDEHEATATSMSDLGLLLRMKGDLAGAEALLRQTLATTRKVQGDDHPDVATALNNVALTAGERGDFATAESLLRQAADISRKTLGDNHHALAAQLNNLSRALSEQGKHDEAGPPQEEALNIVRSAYGAEHPTVGQYLANLARVHLARRDFVTSERMAREALAIRRRTLPEDDWRVASSKSILGAALTELRRYEEAETLLTEAARVLKDIPGPQGREAKVTRARLAALRDATKGAK